jgi:hypothetical protein
MARSITAELSSLIEQLQGERLGHVRAIAEIDEVFSKFGIQPRETPRRGRPPRAFTAAAPASAGGALIGAAAAAPTRGRRGRRPRGRFGTSGTQSVVDFVAKAGKGGASSSQISKHWKSEGRAGEPFVTLAQLIKTKRLRKQAVKGQRGSQYFSA